MKLLQDLMELGAHGTGEKVFGIVLTLLAGLVAWCCAREWRDATRHARELDRQAAEIRARRDGVWTDANHKDTEGRAV